MEWNAGAQDYDIDQILWPLTDHQGTVRDLAKVNGSGDTEIVNTRTYDAYGNLLAETAPAVDHLFGFTARPTEGETDLQNNLNRWYDAAIGTWINEDLIGFEGGDANLYRYCGNDPVNSTDPSGLVGYREDFIAATPGMPADWRVHHTHQQAEVLKRRFRDEMGIDVDDVDHLRAIDPELHKEINNRQNEFWDRKIAEYKVKTRKEAMEKVPLNEVIEHQKEIEKMYGKYWARAGATKEEIASLKKKVKGLSMTPLAKNRRKVQFMKNAGLATGAIAVLGALENALVAKEVIMPSEATSAAYKELLKQYELTLRDAQNGRVSQNRWGHLDEALVAYLDSLGLDARAKAYIRAPILGKSLNP